HALLFGVGLDQSDLFLAATCQTHIAQGLIVNGEHRYGRTVLGTHIPDRGAVCQWYLADARTIKLDKLAHNAVLAHFFSNGQHQVSSSHALGKFARQFETNHTGYQHGYWLA